MERHRVFTPVPRDEVYRPSAEALAKIAESEARELEIVEYNARAQAYLAKIADGTYPASRANAKAEARELETAKK